MDEPYATYVVAAIALIGGWIAFKIVKKIIVALLVIGLLLVVGLYLLFSVLR
jgi:hypothetical protein